MKFKKPSSLLAKAVLNYGLVILLSLGFWGKQAFAFTDYTGTLLVQSKAELSFAKADLPGHPCSPFSVGNKVEFVAEEPETLQESEADDDAGLEWITLLQQPVGSRLTAAPVKNLLTHLRLAISSRPSVSLFVLHHSWKTYLV